MEVDRSRRGASWQEGCSAAKKVTVQQHHICFVIGPLMCKKHTAQASFAHLRLLNSYGSGFTCILVLELASYPIEESGLNS